MCTIHWATSDKKFGLLIIEQTRISPSSVSPSFGFRDEDRITRSGSERLNDFVEERMSELMICFLNRVEIEQEKCDIAVLVRALDRFYSSINTLASLFNQPSFSK